MPSWADDRTERCFHCDGRVAAHTVDSLNHRQVVCNTCCYRTAFLGPHPTAWPCHSDAEVWERWESERDAGTQASGSPDTATDVMDLIQQVWIDHKVSIVYARGHKNSNKPFAAYIQQAVNPCVRRVWRGYDQGWQGVNVSETSCLSVAKTFPSLKEAADELAGAVSWLEAK